MILSDKTIMAMLGEGSLAIFPIESGQIQPASVDIRLGTTFSVVEDTSSGIISMDNQISYKTIRLRGTYYCQDSLSSPPQWNTFPCQTI